MAGPSHQRSGLRVSVVDAKGVGLRAPGLAAWLVRVAPKAAAGEVTVAIVPDARVRALNRTYRAKDKATDVLSFPSGLQTSDLRLQEGPAVRSPQSEVRSPKSGVRSPKSGVRSPKSGVRSPKSAFLGDIVIARGVARRQARDAGHSESIEWRVLALHGLLHLLGYDHEIDNGRMAKLEARLRRHGGLPAGLIERGSRR
jgi:probable rRNA maturation factor